MVRLTRSVKTSGCAAKLPSKTLNEILSSLPLMEDENLIVGFETSDDALVYDLDGENLLVESVYFFHYDLFLILLFESKCSQFR